MDTSDQAPDEPQRLTAAPSQASKPSLLTRRAFIAVTAAASGAFAAGGRVWTPDAYE